MDREESPFLPAQGTSAVLSTDQVGLIIVRWILEGFKQEISGRGGRAGYDALDANGVMAQESVKYIST